MKIKFDKIYLWFIPLIIAIIWGLLNQETRPLLIIVLVFASTMVGIGSLAHKYQNYIN